MSDIVCDGNGQVAVNELIDGINDSLKNEDIGNTVQEDLVSGSNIKTVNNETLLGSGNIEIAVDPTVVGQANILINPEVTRINQRKFNGNSFVNGQYCWDRWKATSTAMTQVVEAGNFIPNTVYTLSGSGVTTMQITSPLSGNWTIPEVPRTARNIQLEPGSNATDFKKINLGDDIARCQRYYVQINYNDGVGNSLVVGDGSSEDGNETYLNVRFPVLMRVAPSMSYRSVSDFRISGKHSGTVTSINDNNLLPYGGYLILGGVTSDGWYIVYVHLNSPGWAGFSAEL